jgi:hypothetical protein
VTWKSIGTFMYGTVVEVLYLLGRPVIAVLHAGSKKGKR